ncbi:xanthine dehydrogenase family protein molybdopterin-binding subunit [Flagellimonas allohymeniacidonis]|uniref:Xanthine dehydrogenase family protein molybdopterin-binding subunit n=1 Tax=Flagellimonas allohymeniacidonis TaxID=2517819 RepID=A0A4Q8QE80_9FLAO|nr:molybdopterin cofactor-binding domain-containing protein [Allomuricauda hymeniacidonis]TAI48802.1 xanthine dehydrogenase family protein molybdopterin-binding subunit [Allomuricauda hymeniacidonis]
MSKTNKKGKKVSRRKFLVRGGLGTLGVLAVGTYLFRNPIRRNILAYANSMDMAYMGSGMEPMIWFEVTSDNQIILHSPKVEMGQGTFTGLAQMAADELDVSMNQIQIVHAQTDTGNIDTFSTGGSTSVAGLWQPLRELAATMREMIKVEGAKKLGVSVNEISSENAQLTAAGNSITYADAVKDVTEWEVPNTPPLRDLKEYKFIGKPIARIDLEAKVFGDPIFGLDAEMPDMLYGAVVRPDKIGATFVSSDTSAAESMPGVVQIIQEEDFVGVVARSYSEAENAKQAIKVDWSVERDWSSEEIQAILQVGEGNASLIQKEGSDIDDSSEVIEMEFSSPIGAHAQIEPNGVLAYVNGDKATIHISTQVVNLTRKEVAKRLGFDEVQVNIVPTYLGGGFGRRLHTPHAVQAAVMSRIVGKPVKYCFSRKEEFQHDMFRPPTHHVLKANLDESGMIKAIRHDFSSGDVAIDSPLLPGFVHSILGADVGAIRGGFCQYSAIPNIRTVSWHVELPFATSWWRSLGLLANTFAWESFMDELAVKSGKDPVSFRLAHIQDDEAGTRLKAVIQAAAVKANYTDEIVDGRAMGFAASTDAGTPCAQVAEVSLKNGKIKVHKVTCAMDPGVAVNPDQVKAQCEGSIIMGISASLFEKMEIRNSELSPTIYGPYQMALMKHAPKEIDVVLLQGIDKPGPVGEPPLGPIGAAIANAVYRLTGERLTAMPLQA